MKILHTSDWHLGMPLKLGTMFDDQRFFLEQLYSVIEEENVDAVICAGDIYDTSVTNAEAIELYNEAVTKICIEMGRKLIVIAGNHDSGARLASCRELLKASGLYVYGKLEKNITPVEIGEASIYAIPFFNRDEVASLFPEKKEQIRSQQDAAQIVCDNIRSSMDKSRANIAVAHMYIVNAELSESDRAAQVGYAAAVSKDVFNGFDYVALGHIHKPQVISETVRYSGSPVKYSFGKEESQVKQVVIFDTGSGEQKTVELKMLHDRKSISGTLEEIMAMKGYTQDYLRVTVNDRVAGLELLSQLREKFPFLLELYGKSIDPSGELSVISADEFEKMDETEIMMRFLAEQYDYTPGEQQIKLFREILEESGEEENLG